MGSIPTGHTILGTVGPEAKAAACKAVTHAVNTGGSIPPCATNCRSNQRSAPGTQLPIAARCSGKIVCGIGVMAAARVLGTRVHSWGFESPIPHQSYRAVTNPAVSAGFRRDLPSGNNCGSADKAGVSRRLENGRPGKTGYRFDPCRFRHIIAMSFNGQDVGL